jgi:cell division protein FtsZ
MSVAGAQGVLFNITGGKNLGLHEISEAASVVYEQAHEDANIIIGSVIDDSLKDEVIITIIATDFSCSSDKQNEDNKDTIERLEECITAKIEKHDPSFPMINQESVSYGVLKEEAMLENVDSEIHIDPNDLDIPAFLRHKG